MTSIFNWKANKRETPKEFLPRNDKPGKPVLLNLPNSSKSLPPEMMKGKKCTP